MYYDKEAKNAGNREKGSGGKKKEKKNREEIHRNEGMRRKEKCEEIYSIRYRKGWSMQSREFVTIL
jgi:hypothetical protein